MTPMDVILWVLAAVAVAFGVTAIVVLAVAARAVYSLWASIPSLDELWDADAIRREMREGTPDTPKRVETIRRADEIYRRAKRSAP